MSEDLTDLVIATFRLNGLFLDAADGIAKPAGLTTAWWQVLGAVLGEPQTVSGIARHIGLTRQSVQRIADLLAEKGIVEYAANPQHRRAKLVLPTEKGRAAIADLAPRQREWGEETAAAVDPGELRTALATVRRLIETLEATPQPR